MQDNDTSANGRLLLWCFPGFLFPGRRRLRRPVWPATLSAVLGLVLGLVLVLVVVVVTPGWLLTKTAMEHLFHEVAGARLVVV